MNRINTLLKERLKKSERTSKVSSLAREPTGGRLSNFTGVVATNDLTTNEKDHLEQILLNYADGQESLKEDLHTLISITSEVKAITNQAALLHGERIKKAHALLIRYRDGAFTAWLMAAYGNRQTPYNFLQYYEFYEATPKDLRQRIELMPRQAIYTLASREGSLDKKFSLVKSYQGQTKSEILQIIRETFPLDKNDARQVAPGQSALNSLTRLHGLILKNRSIITKSEKKALKELLESIQSLL